MSKPESNVIILLTVPQVVLELMRSLTLRHKSSSYLFLCSLRIVHYSKGIKWKMNMKIHRPHWVCTFPYSLTLEVSGVKSFQTLEEAQHKNTTNFDQMALFQ